MRLAVHLLCQLLCQQRSLLSETQPVLIAVFPGVRGPAMEADQQELALLKTVDKPGDGPDVKEEILPSLEPIEKPEAGWLSIKMQIMGFLFSTILYIF
ncbi:hypothetical protein EI555_015460 [Monodon monoceros]|uniref:GAGE domain-containing protein n=1 Tax=Monodon monoceros TaxID=40151 RepID=A0A4U1ECX1_MONMO|nr:hypothetical protein EI555_015460 [Monodon monoceros]